MGLPAGRCHISINKVQEGNLKTRRLSRNFAVGSLECQPRQSETIQFRPFSVETDASSDFAPYIATNKDEQFFWEKNTCPRWCSFSC